MNDLIAVPVPPSIEQWQAASLAHHRYRLAATLLLRYIGTDAPDGIVPRYEGGGLAEDLTDTLDLLRRWLHGS